MKIGVIQFPGSLDDRDAVWAFEQLGAKAELLWHRETDVRGSDAIVVPGGFSYGDHLRCGAIARFAPIMETVAAFARDGGPVIGICNGFQILCEAGLLPGALVRNEGLKYRCLPVTLRVEKTRAVHLAGAAPGDLLRIPIKHGEGRYVCDTATLAELERKGQVALRYAGENPNGSTDGIAGVTNERGNVLGMMPHPEHAVDATAGIRSADGAVILRGMLAALQGART